MALVANINEARAALAECLRDATRGVALTGAGISTESGIPDFRSHGGIWSRYRPIEYAEFITSEEARLEDWTRRFEMIDQIRQAEPNAGHDLLAKLVRSRRFSCVITQNIDGLHQRCGISGRRLIEIHGNGTYARCLACGTRHEFDTVKKEFIEGRAPRCDDCEGILKAAAVSFGEAMPEDEMKRAAEVTESCDLFLVVGSSLQVQPAASLPAVAKRRGARLAIVNLEATPLDDFADLVIRAPIGKVCESLI